MADEIPTVSILGMRVDHTSYERATTVITRWAARGLSRYVCIATVSQVMEAYDAPGFQRVMNEADLVTPDGMPLEIGRASCRERV